MATSSLNSAFSSPRIPWQQRLGIRDLAWLKLGSTEPAHGEALLPCPGRYTWPCRTDFPVPFFIILLMGAAFFVSSYAWNDIFLSYFSHLKNLQVCLFAGFLTSLTQVKGDGFFRIVKESPPLDALPFGQSDRHFLFLTLVWNHDDDDDDDDDNDNDGLLLVLKR